METEKAGTATQQPPPTDTTAPRSSIFVHEPPPDRPPEGIVALSLESEPFDESVVRPDSPDASPRIPAEPMPVAGTGSPAASAVTAPPSFESPADMDKRFSVFHYNRLAFLTTTSALIIILLIGFGAWMFANRHGARSGAQPGSNYSVGGNLNLGGVQVDSHLQVSDARQLTVNGKLEVSDTLILTPTATPSSPTAGQFYFDKSTDTPYYYNGTRFVSLAPGAGVASLAGPSGPGVDSLQGQTGQVTLNAGPGITINGTTISNGGVVSLASGSSNLVVGRDGSGHYTITDTSGSSGVTSITGTSNQVIVSSPTGNVVLSLPQSIATGSSPTFGGLTANGNTLIKTDSVAAFQVQNAAGNSNLLVANTVGGRIGIGTAGPGYKLDVQGGDINTSGIYRVNGAQISSANLSNDSNLAKLSGSNVFTAANTFSGTVAIQGSNSLTLGSAINGGSIIFRDGSTANLGTLQLGGALSGNATFNLPALTGSQTLCTVESGNCAGSGSGITGSGTLNRLSKFTAGQVLGDSSISDDGTVVTVLTGQVIQGSAGLTIGAGGVNGKLVFKNAGNGNTLTLQSGATTGNLAFTLPTGDGADGDCLQTDGSGVLAFAACTGGVGGGVTSVNTLTGVLNIVGTANQVSVSSAGDTITLSLPQDINTGGNANFRTVTLTGQAAGDNLIVANAISGATGNLLDLKVNNASKFTVSPNGDVNTTGQYQVNGSQISSANLSNDSNLAKLNGTGPQIFTGNNKFTGTMLTQLDSSTAFEIQNAAGTSSLLVADTTTTRLGVGTAAPGYTLDVNGDVNTSGVYRINGATICSSGGCTPTGGSGDYIQNGTSPQTANFNITGNGTIGTNLIVNGTISSPGSGTGSEHFGDLSSVGSNNYALAVGNSSTVISDYGTAVGQGAVASFGGTALGASANANAYSIAIGRQAATTAADQLVIGSAYDAIYDGYIGDGVTNATPTNFTLHATGGSGTDIQGASLALAGGQGTGTGNGGDINFQIAKPVGTSGSSLNTLSTVASLSGVNGAALFKNAADSTAAFQVQNSGGSNLIVADTANSRVGINTGSIGLSTNLNVYNSGESTTQTQFTQNMTNAGINLMTDYVQDAYTAGLFWSTQNNNPTSPKAGIYTQLTNSGSKLLFGTSNSYSAGLTNTALTIGYDGDSVFRNGVNSAIGFQVQNAIGAGVFTINTSTGATLTSSLFVDTLGSGSTTALCWNNVTLQVSSCASSGSIGYWNRVGTTLQPANAGDNITTTGAGAITSAGLLTGQSGLTVTGGTANVNATGSGAVNIGNTTAGGAVAIQSSGSNPITIKPGGGSNTGVIVQPNTDSTAAFQIQDASGDETLNVDTSKMTTTLTAGTDTATLSTEIFTGSTHFTAGSGWTTNGLNGQSASITHTSGTTAKSPTPALGISGGNYYLVSWDVTNPNSGGSLTITMGGQTVAAYNFDDNDSGTFTFSDSAIIQASSTANLSFTPNSAFTGTIDNISVKRLVYNDAPVFVINNTSGASNLEVRASSDFDNLFMGDGSGAANVSGDGNLALGTFTLQNNVSGDENTALGQNALQNNITGDDNVGIGFAALNANNTGDFNVAIGSYALNSNTGGGGNVAIGASALQSNIDGFDNIGIGTDALRDATTASYNLAIGSFNLQNVTTAGSNIALGYSSLRDTTDGYNNNSIGVFSLEHNTSGADNVALGTETLQNNDGGSQNVVLGNYSMINNDSGFGNVAIGTQSLESNISGSYNTAIGREADTLYEGLQNATAIGAEAEVGSSNTIVLGYSEGRGLYNHVGIGTSYAQNPFEVAPNTYDSGTITQAGGSGTVVGSGTTFTSQMVGSTIFYPDGSTGVITAFTNATHITSSNTTGGWSGADYAIVWGGFNVNSDASVYLQNTSDTSEAFSVVDTAGHELFNVNTSESSVNVKGSGDNGGGGRLTFGDYDPADDLAVFVGEALGDVTDGIPDDTDTLQLNGATGVQITSGDYSSPETVGYFNYDSARDSGVLALGESTSGGYLEFDNSGAFKWSIGMDSSDACGGTPSDALYFYTSAGGCALQFAHGGEATFTSEDDTNAFQILNGNGDQVINVDTTGTADTFLINQRDNNGGNLFHIQRQSDDAVIVDESGHTTFRTLTGNDGANAFRLQNSATNTNYFTTDSSNYTVTVSGTTTTFGSLTLTNAHFKSTQTTKPGNNTPTNCGTSPSAATAAGSTDSAGSFTITTGTGSSSTTCDTQFNFNKSYGAAPKSIIVVPKTDAASAARQIYVSASAAGSFTVKFGVSAGGANSTTYSFYYWIVE